MVALCNHPVGHHTVRLCFENASSVDKERIVTALSDRQTRGLVANSREGKVVVRLTNADLYGRSASEWKALIARQKKAEAMLQELETGVVLHSSIDACCLTRRCVGEAPARETEPVEVATRPVERKQLKEASSSSFSSHGQERPSMHSPAEVDGTGAAAGGGRKRKRKHNNKGGQLQEGDEEETKEISQHKHKHEGGRSREDRPHKSHRVSVPGSSSGNGSETRADMKKIKALKSGKMMSIKRLTEELQK
jgi:hypothetical protein